MCIREWCTEWADPMSSRNLESSDWIGRSPSNHGSIRFERRAMRERNIESVELKTESLFHSRALARGDGWHLIGAVRGEQNEEGQFGWWEQDEPQYLRATWMRDSESLSRTESWGRRTISYEVGKLSETQVCLAFTNTKLFWKDGTLSTVQTFTSFSPKHKRWCLLERDCGPQPIPGMVSHPAQPCSSH